MAVQDHGQQEDLYTYDSFGATSGRKKEGKFLWWCAGAHEKLLNDLPSEHSKYSGLGAVILATFVLASLAAGYAVYTVFGNLLWSIAFALIWGLIIFNFDRFLVSTMRKYGISRRKQITMAIPRIALALLIGITIARPLEMKIFEKEINVKMEENLQARILANDSLLERWHQDRMAVATLERDRLMNRKAAIEDTLHQLQQAYVREADGTGGSMQRGIENITRLKQDAYLGAVSQFKPELAELSAGIRMHDSTLAQARNGLQQDREEFAATARQNLGFLERNKALSDLAGEESSVWWTVLLVSLLIILIETGPVLSKLIMPVGPYDVALAKEELLKMAASENEIRKGKEVDFERRKHLYRRQKEMSEELVEKLTALQKKNIDDELDKWERGEWSPKDHRASMDEVMRKIREKYQVKDDDMI